jgi:hypothetical protein
MTWSNNDESSENGTGSSRIICAYTNLYTYIHIHTHESCSKTKYKQSYHAISIHYWRCLTANCRGVTNTCLNSENNALHLRMRTWQPNQNGSETAELDNKLRSVVRFFMFRATYQRISGDYCEMVWSCSMTVRHNTQPGRPNSGSSDMGGRCCSIPHKVRLGTLGLQSLWAPQIASIRAAVCEWSRRQFGCVYPITGAWSGYFAKGFNAHWFPAGTSASTGVMITLKNNVTTSACVQSIASLW